MKSSREEIQKLFTGNELCMQFINASPDAIVVLTPDGSIVAYNELAFELFGYKEKQEVPESVISLYEDIHDRDQLLSLLMNNGSLNDFEVRLKTVSGLMVASVNASVLELAGEKFHIATIRDVTAKKESEEKLKKSEEKFSRLFEAATDAIILIDEQGSILDCNQAALKLFVISKNEFCGSSFLDFAPEVQPDGSLSREYFFSSLADLQSNPGKRIAWQHRLRGGTLIDCNITLSRLEVEDCSLFMCVVSDLSKEKKFRAKSKLDEIRFEALSAISRMVDADLSSIYDYALEAAVSVTESSIGYIFFLNEDETELSVYAWSKNAVSHCNLKDYPEIYKVDETGMWADAIRLRQPIITNDYAGCPYKKGLPEGHIHISRHMNVPLFDNDHIVLLAGVGNKESDYTQEDVRQLTMLMEGMWNIVRRKQADEELRKAYGGLEREVYDRTEKLSMALSNLKQKNSEIRAEVEYRREIENKLKKNIGRLALATRSAGMGVWEWDLVDNKLFWDERMFEMYKCMPEAFNGAYDAWRSRVHPDDLGGAEMVLSEAVEGDGHFDWEFRIVWPEGEIRHIKASALGLHDPEGQIHSMIGINYDVTERRRLEQRLRRFERIIAVTPDLVSLVDSEYRYVIVNDSYVKAFGMPREYFEGRLMSDVTGMDIFLNYSKPGVMAALDGKPQSFEGWVDLPKMGRRYFSITYRLVTSENDDERFVAIAAHDITGIKKAEEDRRHIFEVSLDMLGVVDFNGRFIEVNPAWQSILGWNELELKGKKWIEFVHPEDWVHTQTALERLLAGDVIRGLENRYRCSHGEWCWVSWNLHTDREQMKITAVGRDVSKQKKMIDELKLLARTDALTGADNRRFFIDRAREEVDRTARYGGSLGLLMLDIDHFKTINDSYGHDAGDQVLRELVNCSIQTLRSTDLFGRIGGEEFAALLLQGTMESYVNVAERLREVLSELEVRVGENRINFTVSIGLTIVRDGVPSLAEAMKHADRCLYKAKNEGRNRVVSLCP